MSAERFVTSDGTALAVERGEVDDAAGTVVLVHGWTQDRRTWDRVLSLLPPEVRSVRYDLRGHGESGHSAFETTTIDRLADDLAEVIEAFAPSGRLVLAGHSMGGMTIMALADRHPELVRDRVHGVAFVSTACANLSRVTLGLPGALGTAAHRVERKLATALVRYRRERLPLPRTAARLGARWLVFGRKPRRSDVESVADQLLRVHPASMGAFRNEIALHDRTAALAVLRRTPSVVMAGMADRLCSTRHARAIADELEAGRLVLCPGAGHMLPQERAHEVAREISILCRVPSASLPVG
ncbi:alpha/beta fold hydrolase [Saccharomonospora glauca]|uniref:Putative hydrolase or acyltransferase of alpha/beta superfamily n=1 Tax=Saccharomonospora glauca K62 TaxID=928724 RepID=I1CYB4_9PSEU|nr:alpha/beta hydrolase [Saccharomonospora glauca]EIE97688.1 putative hydrolase or acyltransferase of alpha/beta superfamily [Saccharomonospora glauca K62]